MYKSHGGRQEQQFIFPAPKSLCRCTLRTRRQVLTWQTNCQKGYESRTRSFWSITLAAETKRNDLKSHLAQRTIFVWLNIQLLQVKIGMRKCFLLIKVLCKLFQTPRNKAEVSFWSHACFDWRPHRKDANKHLNGNSMWSKISESKIYDKNPRITVNFNVQGECK